MASLQCRSPEEPDEREVLVHLLLQARIEAVGQVLMWKAVEAAPGLQRLGRRSRRPARAASDRYEEHMLLPDDRVALLTNQRLMLVSAPGFAKVGTSLLHSSVPVPGIALHVQIASKSTQMCILSILPAGSAQAHCPAWW